MYYPNRAAATVTSKTSSGFIRSGTLVRFSLRLIGACTNEQITAGLSNLSLCVYVALLRFAIQSRWNVNNFDYSRVLKQDSAMNIIYSRRKHRESLLGGNNKSAYALFVARKISNTLHFPLAVA